MTARVRPFYGTATCRQDSLRSGRLDECGRPARFLVERGREFVHCCRRCAEQLQLEAPADEFNHSPQENVR